MVPLLSKDLTDGAAVTKGGLLYNHHARHARLWMLLQVFVFAMLLYKSAMMVQHSIFFPLFLTSSGVIAAGQSEAYYFEQTQDFLATMQQTYWNGTYWPDTIQWIGAVIDTVVASTERTYTSALAEYEANGTSDSSSASKIRDDIEKYYAQIQSFFDSEEVNEIVDDAYDDVQWVVLEWLEVIKFAQQYGALSEQDGLATDIQKFAHRAHIFYDVVQDQYDTSQCEGGITWNPTLGTYKNAITNELLVSSSVAMYLYFPGDNDTDPYPSSTYQASTGKTRPALPPLVAHDPLLLDNAKKEWAWFKSHNFTNAQGLVVDGFHISDGQTTCDERNEMVYSYNQGVVLSGLRGLWEATGDTSYLEDGYGLISTAINATGWNGQADQWAGLGRNGIMEDYCDASADCSQDNLIFKGVYFEHLDLFCEPLPTQTPLIDGLTYVADASTADRHAANCASYFPWVQHNADAALSTRDSSNIIGQWWGASTTSTAQELARGQSPQPPKGSIDIINQPWLLNSAPWKCEHIGGCQKRRSKRRAGQVRISKANSARQSADQVRTVETQAQGLSVIKAAADLSPKE